jgi:hypothetical protein
MTCATPNREWTITVTNDASPNKPSSQRIIVFCLAVDSNNGKINGAVSLSDGTFLSSVTGIDQPIMNANLDLNTPLSLMTLIFTWGTTNVTMTGYTFSVGPLRKFSGRYTAFESAGLVSSFASVTAAANPVLPTAPSDGDTGTGTGTQT